MNKELFNSVKVLNGDTNKSIGEYLGISEVSVCNKVNENGTEFKKGEIAALITLWNLSPDMVERIFFT